MPPSKVTRRAVSGSHRPQDVLPGWQQIETVSDSAVYPYLVRLSLLSYRTQPRFRAGGSGGSGGLGGSGGAGALSNNHFLSPHRTYTDGDGDDIGSGSVSPRKGHSRNNSGVQHVPAAPSFGSDNKLPKEVPKLLQARFKNMALHPDPTVDPQLRRSYLAFYAVILSPESYRRLKESRRAEDLVMMFLSCVVKELNKTSVDGHERNALVDKQGAAFVRLLSDTIRNAGLGSSCSALLQQLQSYEKSLLSSSQLQSRSAVGDASATRPAAVPTFELSDMAVAQDVCSLLLVANSEMQRDVLANRDIATEDAAVHDLRRMRDDLARADKHTIYCKNDFASAASWTAWKDEETLAIANMLTTTFGASADGPASASHDYVFVPPNVRSYYRHILKRCLERDSQNADKEVLANPDVVTVLLSKRSIEILTKIANVWRVSFVARAVLLVDVCIEMFKQGHFTLRNVEDGFNLARHIVEDTAKKTWSPDSWPMCDRTYFRASLDALQETLVDRVGDVLARMYQDSPPKIGPLLEVLEERVFANYGSAAPSVTPLQLKKIESVIIGTAESTYDTLIDEIPRDHTLEVLHVIELADKLISLARRLQKRYKRPLFEKLYIAHLSTERQFSLFAADSQSMFNHITRTAKERNDELPFEDMIILYKKLAEIRDIHAQVSDEQFQFDIETAFFPFIVEWAEASATLAQSWVEPAVASDSFVPTDESAGALYSSSVADVYNSFHSVLNIATSLDWRNDVQQAKVLTYLMKGISSSICHYSGLLMSRFTEELMADVGEEQHHFKSRQEKWLALAKTAMIAKEKIVPYKFKEQSCIKLNDIEQAQKELDKIETDMDSEKQYSILAQVDPPRKATSFIFTVRIQEGENLKACDMNGLSDPYVTLVDQQTRKQIGKTRTEYETLNPRWDEMFEIVTTGPKWLTATVWDENSMTNHDLCGRTTFRLDPHSFGDFGSQNYWLDLDTQGRLLVNITMESERDDIRFYFGKAFRALARTEHDMIAMIVEKFTAMIKFSISTQTLKSLQGAGRSTMDTVSSWLSNARISSGKLAASKPTQRLTQVEVEDSLNPLFDYLNESFSVLANYLTEELRIKVMTKTWKVVLQTIDLLLLPPLTPKRVSQQQLTSTECEIVFTWLTALRDFFHHDGAGPPLEALHSQQYQDIMAIPVYYDLSTDELKRESEKMASLSFKTLQERHHVAVPELIKRKNTVMAHRNRRVLKQQQEKIRTAQRESPRTEDIILRILSMRGEHEYLARRLKQRERIAQTLATESLVKNATAGSLYRND